jgi:PAS domain S-box-containing protein
MSKSLISIPSSKTLIETKNILLDNGITSVPVFDNFGKPMGLLTEIGLVRAFLKVHNSTDKSKDTIFHHREFLEPITIVEDTAPISQATRALFTSTINRLLVRDSKGKFIGMVSPRDILRVVSGDFDRTLGIERELKDTQSALRKVKGKLRDSDEILSRYHDYLEQAPFYIHSLDEEGNLVFVNKRLREELGYKTTEMIGMNLEDIYTRDQVEKSRQGLRKIIKQGSHDPVITMMQRKDGTALRVEAVSSALKAADGKFIATVTMSRPLASDNMLRALNGVLDLSKDGAFD